jgi:hypothetical protein
MKIIIFIVIVFGFTVNAKLIKAQVIATGHISAEIVEVNNISFTKDSVKKNESSIIPVNNNLILSDPDQTFVIGELKISDEGNLSENSVTPFYVSDSVGNKIEIKPSLKLQNAENRKMLQLKANLPFLPEKKKNYKGYYSIIVSYN